MLLGFRAQGIYSLGKKVDLNFVARPKTRLGNTKYEENFFLNQRHKGMKTAVFFGSNASGKTNLFLAIKALKNILEYGLKNELKTESDRLFFKGNHQIFLSISVGDNEGNLFDYEICFDADGMIIEEKLFKNKKNVFIYEDSSLSSSIFIKNDSFEQFRKMIEVSRPNGATMIEILSNLAQFGEVKDFLKCIDTIEVHDKDHFSKESDLSLNERAKKFFQEHRAQVLQLFKIIDQSIDDFNFQLYDREGEERYRLVILRNGNEFQLKAESEGIKKIVKLSIPLIRAIEKGRTVIVDELDSSITTLALIELFNSFVNVCDNQKGQLIISSHNLLLFDVSFLNSQQIFLVQKDDNLCTFVKSYYEYDVRSDKKQVYIDYLNGAYDGE